MARDLRDFKSVEFLSQAKLALQDKGFVSNNHIFTPFGSTMNNNIAEIGRLLKSVGFKDKIAAGQIGNPDGATTYFIYSTTKYPQKNKAEEAVKKWVINEFNASVDD